MKHFLPVMISVLLGQSAMLRAVQVELTDGQIYPDAGIRRNGQNLMLKVTMPGGTSSVEIGMPLTRIARVSFPEPAELAKARDAESRASAQEVIDLTASHVASQGEFKDVPGSWWPQMASLRLLALASLGKNAEAAVLAREIGASRTPGSDSLSRGGTLLGSLPSGETEAVVVGAKALPRIGGDQGSALAQLALGQAMLLKKDYVAALRAFLTITVFYPSASMLQPAALQGAAEAYAGMKEQKNAVSTLERLVNEWPKSPLAAEAKKRAEALTHS